MILMPETLKGTLEHIVYANEDNHFTVGRLRVDGKRVALIPILGNLPGVQCGENLHLVGEWETNREHGKQFRFTQFDSRLPSSVHGIRQYLGSGLIHGIGPKMADRIVDKFGADTLRILSEESGRLEDIPGIGRERAKSIKQAWKEQAALRSILTFLKQYGVGTALCLKLIHTYGTEAETILKNDPYRVAREMTGVGFRTADKIALNLGFATDSRPRLEAGLTFALGELEGEGHTAATPQVLLDAAAEALELNPPNLQDALAQLLANGLLNKIELPGSMRLIQRPQTAGAERRIADGLRELAEASSRLPPIMVDKAIAWAQDRAGFVFAPAQTEGLHMCLSHKLSILTGGPGTGKTTILRALVEILSAKRVSVILGAPTGRAAQRLAETTAQRAYTLHRLILKAKGRHKKASETLSQDASLPHLGEAQFAIIDEASMIDVMLAADFISALNKRAHLVLVGDSDQLPSVGPGNVLADLLAVARA